MEKLNKERQKRIVEIIRFLRQESSHMEPPTVLKIIKRYGRDPYLILISCLLSLRTRDTVSYPVSIRLFGHAKTPQEMVRLSQKTIEKLVHSVGFYRNKARSIVVVSEKILDTFHGQVPKTRQELLSLPGVGLKTANLVLGEAFGIPAICVDTHVHRIANQIGLVHTKTPEQTERELTKLVPKRYWIELNPLFVMWGQNRGPIASLQRIWHGK